MAASVTGGRSTEAILTAASWVLGCSTYKCKRSNQTKLSSIECLAASDCRIHEARQDKGRVTLAGMDDS